jgi:molecular chaperone HscB
MSSAAGSDPFAVFGIPRSLDLDEKRLEQRYLELSRQCHPDLHRSAATADCAAILRRAADVNDAWRVLRNPWDRARALLELRQPGILDANKKLDEEFLLAAMELAERTAQCSATEAPALRAELEAKLADDLAAIRRFVAAGDLAAGARTFQQAKYHRKALTDLEANA